MRKLIYSFYSGYALILFFLLAIFIFIAYVIASLLPISDKGKLRICYRANNLILTIWGFLTGIQMSMIGREKISPNDKAYIFTGNHVNMLDIAIMGRFIDFYGKPLAKKEIVKIPILGFLFKTISILVDRESGESRQQSLEIMTANLQKGVSVLLMPEGTRNRTPDPLMPFKLGAFRLSIHTGVPIVPFVLLNLKELQPVKSWQVKPGHITLKFLDPIYPHGFTIDQAEEYASLIRTKMLEVLLTEDSYWVKNPPVQDSKANPA